MQIPWLDKRVAVEECVWLRNLNILNIHEVRMHHFGFIGHKLYDECFWLFQYICLRSFETHIRIHIKVYMRAFNGNALHYADFSHLTENVVFIQVPQCSPSSGLCYGWEGHPRVVASVHEQRRISLHFVLHQIHRLTHTTN